MLVGGGSYRLHRNGREASKLVLLHGAARFQLALVSQWTVATILGLRSRDGKRAKYLWRKVGPARWLTLLLQKAGDSTRWVTLLTESVFYYFNDSPCFERKCVKRWLIQGSSCRRVTLLLETSFLHISGS